MKKSDVIKWYEENTSAELNEPFLDKMIELGIISEDVDLSFLNQFLLESFNNSFVVENGKYRVKKNRLSLIEQSKVSDIKPKRDDKIEKMKEAVENIGQKTINRFKIEKLKGNRLKLVKRT